MSPAGPTTTQPTSGPGLTCATPFFDSSIARAIMRRSISVQVVVGSGRVVVVGTGKTKAFSRKGAKVSQILLCAFAGKNIFNSQINYSRTVPDRTPQDHQPSRQSPRSGSAS